MKQPEHTYDAIIQLWADSTKFVGPNDWKHLKAQIKQESVFDPDAVSPVGAKGLAQFMPDTWEWAKDMGWIARNADPFDPQDSIMAQCHYMRWLLDRLRNDWALSLAAYNWGLGNVNHVMYRPNWTAYLPVETQTYLKKIDLYYHDYLKQPGRYE